MDSIYSIFTLLLPLSALAAQVASHIHCQTPASRPGYVSPNCGRPGDSSGAVFQTTVPGDKCGICGDNYTLITSGAPHPFPYEYGGINGTAGLYAQYRQNGSLVVNWVLKVIFPHKGFYSCYIASDPSAETLGFAAFAPCVIISAEPLTPYNASDIIFTPYSNRINVTISSQIGYWEAMYVKFQVLITDIQSCENCVLLSNYRAGTDCTDQVTGEVYECPAQETFRECSDFGISAANSSITQLQSASYNWACARYDTDIVLAACDATQIPQSIMIKQNPFFPDSEFTFIFFEESGNCLTLVNSGDEGSQLGVEACNFDNNYNQLWKTTPNGNTFFLTNKLSYNSTLFPAALAITAVHNSDGSYSLTLQTAVWSWAQQFKLL